MAELKQTYCSCYTAVRSSKKSCWRILDFITKQSANRLQLHQLTEEIRRRTHRSSMAVLEGAEGWNIVGKSCSRRLISRGGQVPLTFISHQNLRQCVNTCWRHMCWPYLLFTCPCTSVSVSRAPRCLYFSGTQCKQDENL